MILHHFWPIQTFPRPQGTILKILFFWLFWSPTSHVFEICDFPVRLSEPLLNQNLLDIRRERKKLRRFHYSIPKKDLIEAFWWKNSYDKMMFFWYAFWAQSIVCDSHNFIDSIGSMDSIDSVESEDSTDSITSIDSIDSIDSILVPHKRPPTFTPHTKGRALRARKQQYRWGARFARAPSVLLFFPLCVVWMLAVFCVARV